jgi:anti-sigma-K factor RskA
VTEEALLELAPIAALGALDGEDGRAFIAEGAAHPTVVRELRMFEDLVARLGLASEWIPPRADLGARVLAAATSTPRATSTPADPRPPDRSLERPSPSLWRMWLPLAAAGVAALGALTLRSERDEARRLFARAQIESENLANQNRDLQSRLRATERRLEAAEAFRALVAHPGSRVAGLAGLPSAPAARGRVVWNAERREAVLLATGLPPTPAGKAYEAWVIAGRAPVAAGVFRVNETGTAVHPLPRLDDVARVKTFAVTLEPEAGTVAPTGPMVLAGPAL